MKTIIIKLTCTVLAILTLVLLAPSFAVAEEKDSNLPLNIEANVLDNDTEKAEILDVKVNNLLGIDNINIEIPKENHDNNSNGTIKDSFVNVSVKDEKIDDIQVDVLAQPESALSSKAAVVDITVQDLSVVDNVNLGVLKQEEISTEDASLREEAVIDTVIQDMILVDNLDVAVLKQEEISTESVVSSEKAVNSTINDESNQGEIREQQAIHVKFSELPILETLHVGVLENQSAKTNDSYYENSKLLTLGLGDSISSQNASVDELELSVLESSNLENGKFLYDKSSVVGGELANSFLGDLSTFVLVSESTKDEEFLATNSGVVELVGNELPIVNGIHLGVLDQHEQLNGDEETFSKGVLQLEMIDDVKNELRVDVLTCKGYTNNVGTFQRNNTIALGLTNDYLGNTEINILPRESYVAAQPVVNPTNPSDESEENTDVKQEESNSELPGTVDDHKEGSTDEETNEGKNEHTNDVINETTEEITNENSAENSIVGFNPNSKGLSENNTVSNNGIFTGTSLPKTGGFFNSMMLLLMAVCLLGGGVTIRKLA